MNSLTGIGVSSGQAIGPVAIVAQAEPLPDEPASQDIDTDATKIEQALKTVSDRLNATAEKLSGDAAEIIEATAMIAADPGLVDAAKEQLQNGLGPAHALQAAIDAYAEQFQELGGYFAERVADLKDVGQRGIAQLLGRQMPGIPELSEPSIVVAEDLAPVETAQLDPNNVIGIVTQAGGRTSHTAILASGRGIPALVQVKGCLDLTPGTVIGIDGDSGELVINPDDAYRQKMEQKRVARQRIAEVSGPGKTKDGHPVALYANVGNADDALKAGQTDVEGVGLFRTEFLHLDADTAPSVDDQAGEYAKVFAALGNRPVTVRALDAGADKPLAFADLGPEPNPALGRRGLRLMQARPDLLEAQLEALAKAAKQSEGQVKVMAPMVATAEEAKFFTEQAKAKGLDTAGVMVEIPAAALMAEEIFNYADFVSLGTNDLAQYTMAADRMVGELSDLLDPWQPAVLKLVKSACDAGISKQKPVGVCGESGGDPLMALVLTGLGVTSLSMSASRVQLVRFALSLHTLEQCQEMAQAALSAANAAAGCEAVCNLASTALTDLL